MPKVLVTAPGVTGPDDPRLGALRDAGWQIRTHRWPGGRPPEEEVIELVQGNDAVIASAAERYTRSVVQRADTLKHIARWGVGFETVDVPAATDNGVVVTTTQGGNHWAVADHTFGQMLAFEPVPDLEFCKRWNVELVPTLEELFRRSDYLSVHAPGDPENYGLVN